LNARKKEEGPRNDVNPGMPFHPLHEAGLASGPSKGHNFHQKAEPVEQNLSEREEMKLYMS